MSIDTPTREILDRRRVIWDRQPNLHYDEVIALADAELAAEAEQQAEAQRKAQEITDSIDSMTRCSACGEMAGFGVALCEPCTRAAIVVRAERAALEQVGGRSRRQLVERYLDWQEAS